MLEIALHTGTEHPDLVWIAVASALSFAGGVSVERYVRSDDPTADPEQSKAAGAEE